MVNCSVFGCKSNNNKKLKRNQGSEDDKVHFFRFPVKEDLRNEWIMRCNSNKCIRRDARVCSNHFTKEDYQFRYMEEVMGIPPTKIKLKDDAVPSLNLPIKRETSLKDSDTDNSSDHTDGNFSSMSRKHYSKRKHRRTDCFNSDYLGRGKRESKEAPDIVFQLDDSTSELEEIIIEIIKDDECDSNDRENKRNIEVSKIETAFDTDKKSNKHDVQLRQNDEEMLQLRRDLKTNEFLLKSSQQQLKAMTMKLSQYKKLSCNLRRVFSVAQLVKLMDDSLDATWNSGDVTKALDLFNAGPKAYCLLLKWGYPLPTLSYIRKWKHIISDEYESEDLYISEDLDREICIDDIVKETDKP